jgi:hypothetical protein
MIPYWEALWKAVNVQTQEEADQTLEELIKRCQKEVPLMNYGEAKAIQLSNIGWFFGEVDRETRERAMKLYPEAEHPIFGRDYGDISPDTLLSAGMVIGRALRKGKDIEAAIIKGRKVIKDANKSAG